MCTRSAGADVIGANVVVGRTRSGVVGMYTTSAGIATIRCTCVTVVAVERGTAYARAARAGIVRSASITITARGLIIGMHASGS